ncbi:hypothetical protein TNCV_4840711 [Trichonephila clavipes]|nr:hypothetical protein TNCV_4840711 [Trichonephila clavipes]
MNHDDDRSHDGLVIRQKLAECRPEKQFLPTPAPRHSFFDIPIPCRFVQCFTRPAQTQEELLCYADIEWN